ncbi:protein LTV1 homolog isoform X1 [Oryza brachyantha]|uniref:protein LTV1 homolog isoform X2 n=1 Tax=Oryza brachyantha TaxID=4533 RepID=UPI0003EADA8D|nr:protein LTV1 homolog isoform X2 [Oryza brachyantha]XP_015690754.1 protein LTV1 homolog isoform X1 [Oryza brachyantha]
MGGGGGGGGRKPRKFATFRLFPRAGAADPNDRVFVRVDNNDYSVPGFGDDEDAFDPSLSPAAADRFSSGSGPLPDHIRREILELGLPDDGYNYLHHLRELRPSAAAAASSFVPNQDAPPLPLDVKAYDASRVRIASGKAEDELDEGRTMCKVAAKTAPLRRIERAVDPDIARLLDESDVSHGGSEDEGLEEDFVVMANRAEDDEEEEEEDEMVDDVFLSDVEEEEELEEDEPKQRVRRLLDEQFDLLALEEYGDSDDDDQGVRDGECELPTEVIDELKLFHSQNVSVTEEYRTPADFVRRKLDLSTAEDVDESANVIQKCAEYAERYLNETAEEEEVVLVSESSDESEVWDCETIVTTYSNLDNHPGKIQTPGSPKKRLPKVFPGETATTKDIIKLQGKERLPVEYLPQRKRKGEKEKAKPTEAPSDEDFKKGAQKETKEEKKARKAAVKEEKREARKAKKELKGLYKFETQKAQKVAAVTGPASIRLM